MTIREYLKSIGATENELTAKVVTRMEQKMLFDSDLEQFRPDTVLKIVEKAAYGLERADDVFSARLKSANEIQTMLDNSINEARSQINDLHIQTSGIKEAKINNEKTRDAVMAFVATLNATKQVFGENNITAEVMIAAINAGSYIAWRGIMGPKNDEISEFENRPKRIR